MRLAASASCGAECSSVPSRSTTMARTLTGMENLRMAAACCMAAPLLTGRFFGSGLVRFGGFCGRFPDFGHDGLLDLDHSGFLALGRGRFFACGACGRFFNLGGGAF